MTDQEILKQIKKLSERINVLIGKMSNDEKGLHFMADQWSGY